MGALLVWAAACLGLEEIAGDTVNRVRQQAQEGRPHDPPQVGRSSQGSGNIDSSKPLCLTFGRKETGGSHGPMCGMSCVWYVLRWGWGTGRQGLREHGEGGRHGYVGLSALQLRRQPVFR